MWPATAGRTGICKWAMGCCPRGQGRAWTRHINFRAAQQSKKSPAQAEGSCKGSRDASVERRASHPSCRAGRPGAPPAIFPPSRDLSYAMIPGVQHLHRALGIDRDGHRIIERKIERPQSVAVETAARAGEGSDDATADFADTAIAQVRKVDCVRTTRGNRPRIAQFGRGGGSPIAGGLPNAIHWQIRNRNFEALYFLIPRFISKFFPSNRWGRKHIAHRSLYTSVPASGWFRRDCRRKQRVFRRIVHQLFPHAAAWMDAPTPAIPVIKLLRCMWTRSI